MKITALGTGDGSTILNYHTSFIINCGSSLLLFDCGYDIKRALNEHILYSADLIDNIFISHLHDDHIGGLPWFGFKRYFNKKYHNQNIKPNLYIEEKLSYILWENCLSGTMGYVDFKHMKLDDYFNVIRLESGEKFKISNVTLEMLPIEHLDPIGIINNYGLFIHYENKTFLFTGDAKWNPKPMTYLYEMSDYIFHDCEMYYDYLYKNPIRSGVHSHYEDLKTLPEKIKNKIMLTHYNDTVLKNDVMFNEAEKDGFIGFLLKGTELFY